MNPLLPCKLRNLLVEHLLHHIQALSIFFRRTDALALSHNPMMVADLMVLPKEFVTEDAIARPIKGIPAEWTRHIALGVERIPASTNTETIFV